MLAPLPVISVSHRNPWFRLPQSWPKNRRGRHARWPLLIGLLFLLALIPFALFRSSQVPEAEAAWWNPSWQHRQRIDVTNNTTQQTNVYISVSLDTSNTSKFQADCGDLRFTKQNGQLLSYYVVSGCGTASTSVHIQLDTFPAGAQTFFAYYGNPSADNGFSSNDFLTEATNYTVGGTGSEETGPGPVAYWKFDEGTGSTANDSAGNNSGTITGATWASEDQCVSGKCLSFDGTNDYVRRGTLSNSLASHLTVCAFIKTSSMNGYIFQLNRSPSNYLNEFVLQVSDDGKLQFWDYSTSDGGFSPSQSSNIDINNDAWKHVCFTKSGTTGKYYIDGKLDNQVVASIDVAYGSNDFVVGSDYRGSTDFNGLIDEVKIFPYALTEDQIKTEYNLGAAAVMGTGSTVAPLPGGTLSDSLVAHWAFDEQYGQTAHDKVGNNHGTFGASTSPGSDDPTWTAAGECKVNGCASFDGGDYIDAGTDQSLNITGDISISAWIYPISLPSQSFIVERRTGGNGDVPYWLQTTNNRLVFGLYSDGWRRQSSTALLNLNQWNHVAAVADGSSLWLYVNGQRETYSFPYTGVSSPTGTVAIGRSNTQNRYWFGSLDELKIYNTALTAEQVKQDMNAGASVAYSVGSEEADELADGAGAPPIAEWKFDEKQGTLAYDSGGNANDGTVNGATWRSGCQQGACLEFDGSTGYVSIPDSSSLRFDTGNFTMNLWMRPSSDMNAWDTVFSKSTCIAHVCQANVLMWAYDNLRWNVNNSTALWNNYVSLGSSASFTNKWSYISLVREGDQLRGYVNGNLVGTKNLASGYDFSSAVGIKIGGNAGGVGTYFDGQIDHVRIYDYARTPAQIAYDYNRGAPVAHWKFDECEGTVAHDASGNENHGTINIGATGTQTTAGTCSTSGAWANGASGKFEGSLNFDGTDDYVSVADSNSISVTNGPFSYFAWVYVKGSLASNTSVLRKRPSNFVMGYNSRLIHCNLNGTSVNTGTQLLSNSWHFLGCTYDGTTLKGYLDGVLQGSVAATPVVDSNQVLELGGQSTGSQMVNGQIDDVRIYNYVLSPAQVTKVMNEGFGVKYGPVIGNQ